MRTIVHLSDIHFGRVDYATVKPLIAAVHDVRPDLVAISGDLTQRARPAEFCEAREFLDALPAPQIVVPGNHDIPLHNLYTRFVGSFDQYQAHISEELEPYYMDDEIAVAGINTARPSAWKGGRINARQIARARQSLCAADRQRVKVVVTHHPFEVPDGMGSHALVGRADMAMRRLADCGADLFLAGHLHLGYTAHTAVRYEIAGHSALVVQAGTATSTRGRGEPNSFNVIRIAHPEILVERMHWDRAECLFRPAGQQPFRQTGRSWAATETWNAGIFVAGNSPV
jgi:3',5'-cyclic AMP phosphodiesterase CpdA